MKTKTITTTHSKGGVGKTTLTYQFLGYLEEKGIKYIAFDTDIANRTLSTINDYMRAIMSIDIKKENDKNSTLTHHRNKLNIMMVTDPLKLRKLVSHAKESYEYIIIDTGGNMDIITQEAIKLADKIIIPVSHDAVTEAIGFTRFKSVLKKLDSPEVYATFCNVNTRVKDFSNIQEELKKYSNMNFMEHSLRTRALYKTSLRRGLSVAELPYTKGKNYNKNLKKAKEELELFSKEVLS